MFCLSLISCHIDVWDSLHAAKVNSVSLQKRTEWKNPWWKIMEERVPCHSWPIHRSTGTFAINLWASLVFVISCLFFKTARKGIGCSSAFNDEQEAYRGAMRDQLFSLLPDAKRRAAQTPAVTTANSIGPQVNSKQTCVRAAPLKLKGDLSPLSFGWKDLCFSPSTAWEQLSMFTSEHTPLCSTLGSKLNVVFSQSSALNKPSAAFEICP